jgi:nucleoside phosphorylase
MSTNPLHALIDQLGLYIRAVWRCHHASTKEEKEQALQAWRTFMEPFWSTHRIPREAIRGMADPALSWCVRRGFGGQDYTGTVEHAVELITRLAMITAPCAMPSVYANEEDAQQVWRPQGELLMAALASQDALRRLAALTGDEWKGDVRMPWDNDSQRPGPPPDTVGGPSAPTKPSTSNDNRIDTRPDGPSPPEPLIEAAMRDVPRSLADMDNTTEYYAPTPAPGQRIVLHHCLVRALGAKHRHGKAAAAWAIHRLVERGMLTARWGSSETPSVQSRDGTWHGGDRYEVRDLNYSLIESTPSLWDWWNEITNSVLPAEESPGAVEDLPPYKLEQQAWWTPLPHTKGVRSEELLSLAGELDVVLLTATEIELDAVLRRMQPYPRRQVVLQGFDEQETYFLGKFGACVAAATKCRMGSLDAGGAILATQHAQRVWLPRAIVMVGVAMGRDPQKQKIGDALVASQVISYEPQRVGDRRTVNRGPITPANPTLLNRFEIVPHWSFLRPDGSKCKREVGPLLSGEKLVDEPSFKASLFDRYPQALGGDMEGVGLAAAAVRHGMPWVLVKAICDWADGKKHNTHQPLAAAAAVSLVHHVLSQTDVLHGLRKPDASG